MEITNQCNLHCPFCYTPKRPLAQMPLAQIEKLLPTIKAHAEHLLLHVLGEPLLHGSLTQILTACQKHGLSVDLTTNGTLLSLQSQEILQSTAIRRINISLHALPDNYSPAIAQELLWHLLDFSRRATVHHEKFISLRYWQLQPDLTEEGNSLLEPLGVYFHTALDERANTFQGQRLARNIYLHLAPRFSWPDLASEKSYTSGYCYGLLDQIAILVDGTVVPCCLDASGQIALGNIFTSSLENILQSPRAQKIIQGFQARKLVEPLCQKCSFRQIK